MTRHLIFALSLCTALAICASHDAMASCYGPSVEVFPKNGAAVGTNCQVHVFLPKDFYGGDGSSKWSLEAGGKKIPFTMTGPTYETAPWYAEGYSEKWEGCGGATSSIHYEHYVLTPTHLLPPDATIQVKGVLIYPHFQGAGSFKTNNLDQDARCGKGVKPSPASCYQCYGQHKDPPKVPPVGTSQQEPESPHLERGGCSVSGEASPTLALLLLGILLGARRRIRR